MCNDKRWFKTLVEAPIIVKQRDVQLGTDLVRKAAGVGTVELPVKRSAHLQGRYAHDVLVLQNVLYTPGFQFNVVGGSILRQNGWRYDADTPFKGQDSCIIGGRDLQVCYMRHISELPCIRLSGPPNGPATAPSKLEADTVYTVNYVKWPEEERRRFESSQSKSANQQTPKSHTQPKVAVVEQVAPDESSEKPYYTQKEKAWLKKHHGNEYKFLKTFNLSIHKEDDRAEGRHMARSMMTSDEEDDELPDPSEGKKKKNKRGGRKNHNAETHEEIISRGLAAGGSATIDSVEVSRDVKVAGNVAAAELVKVEQTIENTQPGKNKGKNKKNNGNTPGVAATDAGKGASNSNSVEANAINLKPSQAVTEKVREFPEAARIDEERVKNEKKSDVKAANDDTTGIGGGAPLFTNKKSTGDTNVARELTAPQIQSTQQPPASAPSSAPSSKKKSKKGKGKGKSNPPAKVLTPEEEEAAAQSYLQSLLDNVAIKNAQDRDRAEAAPAQTVDTSRPAVPGKQKGNGKTASKGNNEKSDDTQYIVRPSPFALGPIRASHKLDELINSLRMRDAV